MNKCKSVTLPYEKNIVIKEEKQIGKPATDFNFNSIYLLTGEFYPNLPGRRVWEGTPPLPPHLPILFCFVTF